MLKTCCGKTMIVGLHRTLYQFTLPVFIFPHTLFWRNLTSSLDPLLPPPFPRLAFLPSIHATSSFPLLYIHVSNNSFPSPFPHHCHLHAPRPHHVIRECLQVLAERLCIQSDTPRPTSLTDPDHGEHEHQCAWQRRTGNPPNSGHTWIITLHNITVEDGVVFLGSLKFANGLLVWYLVLNSLALKWFKSSYVYMFVLNG